MGEKSDGIKIEDLYTKRGRTSGKRWLFGVYDTGTEKYKYKSFNSKPEGWQWARKQQGLFTLGLDSAGKADLASIGAEYIQRRLVNRGRTAGHIQQVQQVLDDLVSLGARDLKAANFVAKVEKWRAALKSRKQDRKNVFELTPATRNRYLGHIKAITRYAMRYGYVLRDPLLLVEPETEPEAIKPTFSFDELTIMVSDFHRDKPWWLPVVLMVYGGFRIQEAMYLEWQDIGWREKQISVLLKPKYYSLKRQKERLVPLQDELAAILNPMAKPAGWIVSEDRIRTKKASYRGRFKTFLRSLEIASGQRTIHSMRHSFTALLLATGENVFAVRDILGHSDLQTTAGYAKSQMRYREAVKDWPRGEFKLRSDEITDSGRVGVA